METSGSTDAMQLIGGLWMRQRPNWPIAYGAVIRVEGESAEDAIERELCILSDHFPMTVLSGNGTDALVVMAEEEIPETLPGCTAVFTGLTYHCFGLDLEPGDAGVILLAGDRDLPKGALMIRVPAGDTSAINRAVDAMASRLLRYDSAEFHALVYAAEHDFLAEDIVDRLSPQFSPWMFVLKGCRGPLSLVYCR